jgi:hypothetical protein
MDPHPNPNSPLIYLLTPELVGRHHSKYCNEHNFINSTSLCSRGAVALQTNTMEVPILARVRA